MSEELQHKLFHFEAKPPAHLWNKIAESMNVEMNQEFPERLFHFQMAPPEHVWTKIETELDKISTPVIEIKKHSKILQYGSAAAILFGAALLINLLLNKKSSGEINGSIITTNQSFSSPGEPAINQTENIAPSNLLANTQTKKTNSLYTRRNGSKQPVVTLKARESTSLAKRAGVIVPKDFPILQTKMADRYIVFSKATGEAVRLSKKIFSLFACSDNIEDCRQNIESAQQQMASPAMMASTDFNAVLDLLQNMNTQ